MMAAQSWQLYALGSAFFAALTAILAKIGVSEVNSDLATLIRTVVIFFVTLSLVLMRGEWQSPATLPSKTLIFLTLSGFATGLSWLCYYHALKLGPASRVAPIDKLSVVIAVLLAIIFLGERLSLKASLGAAMITIGALLMI